MHSTHTDLDVNDLPLGSLSLNDAHPTAKPKGFPFFDLPLELRIRVYEHVLITNGTWIDLDPTNYRTVMPRMQCFYVSKQMHREASEVFYGGQTFRLFPMHGRFFHTKRPLLARLPPHHRAQIRDVELRLGPGWSDPPRCQKSDDSLGLQDCTSLRILRILVEVDPSNDYFNGFRGRGNARNTYNLFCISLLNGILARAPSILTVEIDAYPSVSKSSPLVVALADTATRASKRLAWGGLRGWDEDENPGKLGLEDELASMTL